MKYFFQLLLLSGLLVCCQPEETPKQTPAFENMSSGTAEYGDGCSEISLINAMCSPGQVYEWVKNLRLSYNSSLINPAAPDAYRSIYKQAIMTGVYGADIGYLVIHRREQEIAQYLNRVEKLAEHLDATNCIDRDAVLRFNKKDTMIDSLLVTTQMNMEKMQEKWQKQGCDELTVLMLTGGFIEGLHLVGTMYQKAPGKQFRELIGEHKLNVHYLMIFLEAHREKVPDMLADMQKLKKCFDKVIIKHTPAPMYLVNENGQQVMKGGGTTTIKVSHADMLELLHVASAIRHKIIK